MPSMSYCMFENTSLEMGQIINEMHESETWDALNLSVWEKDGFFKLMLQCSEFLVWANEMLLNEEMDVESIARFKRVREQIRMIEAGGL